MKVYVRSKRELSPRVSLCRKNILIRDRHQCQYCGSRSQLTMDHVVPVRGLVRRRDRPTFESATRPRLITPLPLLFASSRCRSRAPVQLSKGGKFAWTNITTACASCNVKKSNSLLSEVRGMKLKVAPREPNIHSSTAYTIGYYKVVPSEWLNYVPSASLPSGLTAAAA